METIMSRKEVTAWIITVALSILVVGGYLVHPYVTPCPTEDSYNCTWDGGENGEGASYTIVGTEEDYTLIPR